MSFDSLRQKFGGSLQLLFTHLCVMCVRLGAAAVGAYVRALAIIDFGAAESLQHRTFGAIECDWA